MHRLVSFGSVLIFFCTLLAAPTHAQIYVDRDASGAGDGSSWANAYTNLQTAIDNATGSDRIWIAEGTYKPTRERPGKVFFDALSYRKKAFVIPSEKDGLKLYGGFDGTETALAQRDPTAHRVVLSGDIGRPGVGPDPDGTFEPDVDSDASVSGETVVDPTPGTRSTTDHLRGRFRRGNVEDGFQANAYHVVWMESGLSRSTVLDGVTVTGGLAVEQVYDLGVGDFFDGEQRSYGGGLYCDGCSATIRGVTFQGNHAHERGGGAYVASGGSPLFVNTVFWGNNAGERPPTFEKEDSATYQPFEWILKYPQSSGIPPGTAPYDSGPKADGSGGALYDAGSAEVVNATAYQNTPDAFNGASVENSVTIVGGSENFDLDPDSPGFLQITSETAGAVATGDASLLPPDGEDLDGDGDTGEPLPLDARGAARIQGGALDRGALESGFAPAAPVASPGALQTGETLTITGLGVDDATAVRIGGTPATNLTGTGDSNEQITVTVADGTTSGPVEIDASGGTLTAAQPVAIADAPYGPGQALGGPGTVTLANESAFDFTEGFTVSLWVKGGFEVDKSGDASGWRFSGTPGGAATLEVTVLQDADLPGLDREPITLRPSMSLPDDGQWHHVAGVFDNRGQGSYAATVYVDGVKQSEFRNLSENRAPSVATNDIPVVLGAGAAMDQVCIYDRPLADSDLLTNNSTSDATELNVRRRIHATADPSDGQFDGLLSAYRFDTGDPATAFDYAGPNSGTYQNGAGPVLSTAPVGQDAGSFPIGSDGASFVSGDTDAVLVGLYSYGARDGTRTSSDPGEAFDATLPSGITERAALTWGGYRERTGISETTGDITGPRNPGLSLTDDTVIEYGNIASVSEPVGLLYREAPGRPWRAADATKDPSAQTFRIERPSTLGTIGGRATPPGEYAVASFPFSDVRLTLTPEAQAAASGETVTFTATLTNRGPDDVPGVTVDFDATALSGLTPSGVTLSGTTWDVGMIAGGASATLTLSATTEAGLSALRASLGRDDIDNSNNAAQAVVPSAPAYGPGRALAFDGTDDHLTLSPDVRLDNRSFTVSFWAKRAATGSEQVIVSQGTASGPGESLRIGFRSDDRFTVDLSGAAVTTDAAIADTDWHHWAVVHDAHPTFEEEGLAVVIYRDGQKVKEGYVPDFYRGRGEVLIGRATQSAGSSFAGELDQVRIWNQEIVDNDLSGGFGPGRIRARMHQRLAPGDAKAANLVASYRFDEGSGPVAHSAGQGPLVTFHGDPQWVDVSAAPVGEESAVATSSSNASIGSAGARLSATDASGTVQLYRYGRPQGPVRTPGDPGEDAGRTGFAERSSLTWGIAAPGGQTPDATLTLSYGGVAAPAGPLVILRRDAPGTPWALAPGWTRDANAQTFTRTGPVPTGEVALALNEPATLSLNAPRASVDENTSAPIAIADVGVTDDGVGGNSLSLAGADASAFTLDNATLQLTETPDFETKASYAVTVRVDDPTIPGTPDNSVSLSLAVADLNESPQVVVNTGRTLVEGETIPLTTEQLQAADEDEADDAGSLTFAITTVPANGEVLVGDAPANAFTQADVNQGRVRYRHDGSETRSDRFTFALTDDDGAGPQSADVVFTVGAANDAPTVSGATDQTIQEDASVTVPLIVRDAETASDQLSLSAASGTPGLVPADNLMLSGPAADGSASIDLQPAPNESGTAEITIEATDGTATTSVSLTLTVEAVPDVAIRDGGPENLDFAAEVAPGTDDNPVGLAELTADQEGASLDGVTTTNESPGARGITQARLYRSTDATFDAGADAEIARVDVTESRAEEVFRFDDFQEPIPTSGGFLFVTLNVAPGASDVVRFNLEDAADLTIRGGELASINERSQPGFSALPLSNGSTALPVEMASFAAEQSGEEVALRWSTATETGNAGFDVQRRTASTETAWKTVGRRPGAGTTSEPQTYRFMDTDVPYAADSVTYRLRQVDLDGTLSVPAEITITRRAVDDVELLGTFPNPTRGRVMVRYALPPSANGTARMALFDLLGRQVRMVRPDADAGRHEAQIDVSGLSPGVYFLRLTTERATKTRRLTVMR